MTAPDGEGLAEVIYFPGVTPSPGAVTPTGVRAPESAPESPTGPPASTRAENIAMHALTRRGQSRGELRTLLERRELDPETVEAELERLEGVGLIDDAALAERVIRAARERKRLGRTAIVAELRKRKLDSDTIEAALAEFHDAGDGDSELERAVELARQRASRLREVDRDTAARRLSGFLQRKGYSGDIVHTATSTALKQQSRTVRFR